MQKRTHIITLDCGHTRTCFSNKPGYGYYCIECDAIVSLRIEKTEKIAVVAKR